MEATMAQIQITATEHGFNIIGGAGQLMAPDTLFAGGLMGSNTMVGVDPALGWIWGDNLRQATYGMNIIAEMEISGPMQLGSSCDVSVTAISYWRMQDGECVDIGQMMLPEPLIVQAYWQTTGIGETEGWVAELGDSLAHMLARSGIQFNGGAGDDVFSVNSDALYIRGHSVLNGGAGNDVLTGGIGNDTIRGGRGNDILVDAGGQNLLRGGAGNDIITLGAQASGSTAIGGAGHDIIRSSIGNDTLMGNSGHDQLFGGAGHDVLLGGRGHDVLNGGTGNDRLVGGQGNDILVGDGGADLFAFTTGDRGQDIIRDFEDGQDMIQISGLAGGMAGLSIVQVDANTELYWDGRLQVTLENYDALNLNADDFVFI